LDFTAAWRAQQASWKCRIQKLLSKIDTQSQVWWYTPIIPLRQEDPEFQVNLGYTEMLSQKQKQKKPSNTFKGGNLHHG
jgi:hypothetical protein